jgi:hypothetical protein
MTYYKYDISWHTLYSGQHTISRNAMKKSKTSKCGQTLNFIRITKAHITYKSFILEIKENSLHTELEFT